MTCFTMVEFIEGGERQEDPHPRIRVRNHSYDTDKIGLDQSIHRTIHNVDKITLAYDFKSRL